MDRAFAYVSCSEEDSRVKVQKYCRKIYELGYIPICPRFGFVPFLDESNAEDQQGLAQMSISITIWSGIPCLWKMGISIIAMNKVIIWRFERFPMNFAENMGCP